MTLASDARVEATVVPLLGRIAAGQPTLASEHVEDYLVGARTGSSAAAIISRFG